MMKKALLGLIGSAAILSSFISAAPTITSSTNHSSVEEKEPEENTESSVAEKRGPIAIDLLTDIPSDVGVAPGEEVIANVRIRNAGTEPAHIFVEVTDPIAVGAVTLDGEEDPQVVEFEAGDGWIQVEDGVYFYEEVLEAGEETTPLIDTCRIPNYNMTNDGEELMTGTISMEEVEELLSDFNMQGFSIQGSLRGTPEQIWGMVGGE